MKRTIAVSLMILLLLLSAGCGPEQEETTRETYNYTPAATEENETEDSEDNEKLFVTDTAWQKNFDLTYRYFDVEQGETAVTIREKKCDTFFSAEYLESGDKLYYRQNGRDLDYYALTSDFTGVHSVVKNKRIDAVSSTFMKLSEVSPELPTLANVMYIGDEVVAGRTCKKYLQRAYHDGVLQESVYVWIDAVCGFAARCEGYDADDKMKLSWNLVTFSTGEVSDADASVELSIYDLQESDA